MKKCIVCLNSLRNRQKKFCSVICLSISMKGHTRGFKKGDIPWNKGKSSWNKGKRFSKETNEKMKKSHWANRPDYTPEKHPMYGKHPNSWNKGIPCSEEQKKKTIIFDERKKINRRT